jgi:hypothetical protein
MLDLLYLVLNLNQRLAYVLLIASVTRILDGWP